MRIIAAIFDCDGTLLDTEPLYDAVEQYLINKYGNGEPLTTHVKQCIMGTPAKFNCEFLVKYFKVRISPEEFEKQRDELLVEPFKNCQFKKGARETTHKCKYQLGLKVAIATSATLDNFNNKTFYLKDWLFQDIDLVVTGDDDRIKAGKPAPDIFLLTTKELGVEPKYCIVFEDAANGVQAALSAGIGIVVAVMEEEWQRKMLDNIVYDKTKSKLIVIDSLDKFDFSLIVEKNNF